MRVIMMVVVSPVMKTEKKRNTRRVKRRRRNTRKKRKSTSVLRTTVRKEKISQPKELRGKKVIRRGVIHSGEMAISLSKWLTAR